MNDGSRPPPPPRGQWTKKEFWWYMKTKGREYSNYNRLLPFVRLVLAEENPKIAIGKNNTALHLNLIALDRYIGSVRQIAQAVFLPGGRAELRENKKAFEFILAAGRLTGLWVGEKTRDGRLLFESIKFTHAREAVVAVHICLRARMGINKDVVQMINQFVYLGFVHGGPTWQRVVPRTKIAARSPPAEPK